MPMSLAGPIDRAHSQFDAVFDGAAALISELKRRDAGFLCRTNASGRPPEAYAANLRSLGLPIEPRELLTPAVVAAEHLARTRPKATVMVLGGDGVTLPLTRVGLAVVPPEAGTRADALLVGPSRDLSGRALQVAADAIAVGLRSW
jgi:ribonucleotide monophosphatase NagD (HAD superfamily)